MSVKLDNCPICGKAVNYREVIDDEDGRKWYVPVCPNEHSFNDLFPDHQVFIPDNEYTMGRLWNKCCRKYIKKNVLDIDYIEAKE